MGYRIPKWSSMTVYKGRLFFFFFFTHRTCCEYLAEHDCIWRYMLHRSLGWQNFTSLSLWKTDHRLIFFHPHGPRKIEGLAGAEVPVAYCISFIYRRYQILQHQLDIIHFCWPWLITWNNYFTCNKSIENSKNRSSCSHEIWSQISFSSNWNGWIYWLITLIFKAGFCHAVCTCKEELT